MGSAQNGTSAVEPASDSVSGSRNAALGGSGARVEDSSRSFSFGSLSRENIEMYSMICNVS